MASPVPITPERLVSALLWRYATQRFDPSRPIPDPAWSAILG